MTQQGHKEDEGGTKVTHQGQAIHTEAAEEDGKDQNRAKSRSRVAAPVKMKAPSQTPRAESRWGPIWIQFRPRRAGNQRAR